MAPERGKSPYEWDSERDCKPGKPENLPFVNDVVPEDPVAVESVVPVPVAPRRRKRDRGGPTGRAIRDPENGFQG